MFPLSLFPARLQVSDIRLQARLREASPRAQMGR